MLSNLGPVAARSKAVDSGRSYRLPKTSHFPSRGAMGEVRGNRADPCRVALPLLCKQRVRNLVGCLGDETRSYETIVVARLGSGS